MPSICLKQQIVQLTLFWVALEYEIKLCMHRFVKYGGNRFGKQTLDQETKTACRSTAQQESISFLVVFARLHILFKCIERFSQKSQNCSQRSIHQSIFIEFSFIQRQFPPSMIQKVMSIFLGNPNQVYH